MQIYKIMPRGVKPGVKNTDTDGQFEAFGRQMKLHANRIF